MPEIIPAILTDDIQDLKDKLKKLEGLTDWVQIDIMDGKFVDNKSIDLEDLIGIEHNFNLEIHLMVEKPQKYFKTCEKIKSKRVFFHLEAVKDPLEVIEEMSKYDFEKGISINPPTSVRDILLYVDMVNVVLFLAVNPGWQGQKFDSTVLKKIKKLKELSPHTKIEIDGGINLENIKSVVEAGVDIIDIGSQIVKSDNMAQKIKEFQDIIS